MALPPHIPVKSGPESAMREKTGSMSTCGAAANARISAADQRPSALDRRSTALR